MPNFSQSDCVREGYWNIVIMYYRLTFNHNCTLIVEGLKPVCLRSYTVEDAYYNDDYT